MAALPSPTQVAGNHNYIYEAYYSIVDPNGFGSVGGMEAARFLKRSGLSDVILSRIWDLSDPGGRGSLDKAGMFVALKLVALVQNHFECSIKHINEDVPPPKMGDIPLPKTKPPPPTTTPLITSLPPSAVDWTIKPSEREKYDKLFESLQPLNGLIPGNEVKNVLMQSKLPFDTLGKIWDLADQDKDGMLDRHEFVVAMHLVYKALEKYAIPNTLPPELVAKSKDPPMPVSNLINNKPLDGVKPVVPPPPVMVPVAKPVQSVPPTQPWVVSAEEKSKSDALFIKSDIDKDGFVSGGEIKDVFLRSGVPQQVLAHIWALCDIKQTGKLNGEQFALAMWLVARCLKGVDPPQTLTPEMIPPSFRTSKPVEGLVENNNTRYSNPELDMISKDIEEVSKERLSLETEIAQKEADIKIKAGEIKNLQSELDTLAATLKQLENQKGEAQKRLNDLKAQNHNLELEHATLESEISLASLEVDKLRTQANEQADLLATQESELKSKKELLDGLRQEEQRLEEQKNESLQKLESMTTNLQETQLNISQIKALTTQLEEQTRQINDALALCEAAIESGDASQVPDTALRITAGFRESEYSRLGLMNGARDNDPFSRQNGSNSGFHDDPFQNDAFKSKTDPFNAAFSKSINDSFNPDPFGADPFSDNFDNTNNKAAEPASEFDKDAFGCDPFAVLHAPTRESVSGAPPRPSSPSPALPPKKSKQPPPRPAPPRPAQPPSMKKPQSSGFGNDSFEGGFGSGGGGAGGFADFTNFESKLAAPFQKQPAQSKGLDFSDDPFKDYRYEDPFDITFDDDNDAEIDKSSSLDAFDKQDKFDPFGLDGRQSVPPITSFDPFSLKKESGRASAPIGTTKLPSEDKQLEWAARESLRSEEERRKRQQKEDAELEMALKLSQIESRN
ncbi:unnamed protein product [Ceutorhynchus assimilis]|uniref:Epidermal growth factor receptor substrate 15-like 1 n=1 Tax=Ceutorhynchus assimilis TaxID=467358 RepID=A0A9P0DIK8_9CUCU|nr:unnamed protein product [Ceutorhynchus assimilis]